jgi:N-acetylmuramoyl-L-alanine amidase
LHPAKAQKPLLILLAGALILLLLSVFGVLDPAFPQPPRLDESGNVETKADLFQSAPLASAPVAGPAKELPVDDGELSEETADGRIQDPLVGDPKALTLLTHDQDALTTDGTALKRWPEESSVPVFVDESLDIFLNRPHGPDALKGITVILDPGHGGLEEGVGSFTADTNQPVVEKDIVLNLALKAGEKLRELGAEVLYTRTTDVDVSLFYRTAFVADYALQRYLTLAEQNGYDTAPLSTLRPLMADVMRINHNGADSGGRGIFGGIGTVPDLRLIYDIERQFKDTVLISLHLASDQDTELSGARTIVMSNDFISAMNNEYAIGQSAADLPPNYIAYDTNARLKLANLLQAHVAAAVPELATDLDRIREEDMAVLRLTNVTSSILDVGYISNASDRAVILSAEGQEAIALAIAHAVYQYYCVP